ncbi:hypothetical protein HCA78_12820 [Listeria booriae]|uniref:Uncharacterized protein n=1 Tax=Listeria booriae TaxID=1552123 RepID=A0A842CV10_9LIST|nr:hypothetical protein [Listeria booriae]MBC2004659.1 hypothetical protein [Listeria booriae]
MTVGQLRSILSNYGDDQEVIIDDFELEDYVEVFDVFSSDDGRVIMQTGQEVYL